MKHTVWKCSDNWCFSDGVTRDFGLNMIVEKHDGTTVFTVVVPLKCDPVECGLEDFGTVELELEYNLT